ncbi:MAG: alpha/beta fold hydrolase [Elusimicrobiota bacterium]
MDILAESPPLPEGPSSHPGRAFRPSAGWALGLLLALASRLPAAPAGEPDASAEEPGRDAARRVEFVAADKVRIAADFHVPAEGGAVFVLLHGLGAGRGEWGTFSALLAERGWGSLALDARGHGESGGPRYTTFDEPEDWAKIEMDLAAAVKFLDGEGIPPRRVVLAGASIGANLALRAAVRQPAVPFAILLSPGYDYQGILIREPVLAFDRPLIMAASLNDPYALRSAEVVSHFLRHRESWLLRAVSGHGVGMLEGRENRAFVRELMKRIEEKVAAKIFPSSPSEKPTSP